MYTCVARLRAPCHTPCTHHVAHPCTHCFSHPYSHLPPVAVVNSTLRNIEHAPDTVRPVLLLLAQVAATQPQLATLPEKALKLRVVGVRLSYVNDVGVVGISH